MNDLQINNRANEIITKEMESAGITDSAPFVVLSKLLNAKKMTVDKFGDEHEEEDNAAQGKAVELVLRLKKLLDNKVSDMGTPVVTHRMAPEDIVRLEAIAHELKGLEVRLNADKIQQGVIDVSSTVINAKEG